MKKRHLAREVGFLPSQLSTNVENGQAQYRYQEQEARKNGVQRRAMEADCSD